MLKGEHFEKKTNIRGSYSNKKCNLYSMAFNRADIPNNRWILFGCDKRSIFALGYEMMCFHYFKFCLMIFT